MTHEMARYLVGCNAWYDHNRKTKLELKIGNVKKCLSLECTFFAKDVV